MARGFIRAEVIPASTLLQIGSLATAREKGLLRLEGRDYVVQDGDLIHFRFAV
jgi:ribosome-binding ATPase YchF (GTP1/OBG family)